jgi:LPS O-antigen subunit length determinant protein (WzzB/FepE family)
MNIKSIMELSDLMVETWHGKWWIAASRLSFAVVEGAIANRK